MKVPIGPETAVHILSIAPSGIEWNFLRTRHIVLTVPHLNSSLMRAWEQVPVRFVGGQMQLAERRYPWQPWKREPPQEQPLTGTVTLNKFSGDTYLRKYLPNHQAGREEREQESAMIRKLAKIDLLRSVSKATMQSNTSKRVHKEPCNSPRAAP